MARRQTSKPEVDPPEDAAVSVACALARMEALLRALHQSQLREAIPKQWCQGRRRLILDYCEEPRTQQEIRDHVRSIAGYEMNDYLDDALQVGVLAGYTVGATKYYVSVLSAPDEGPRKGRRAKG